MRRLLLAALLCLVTARQSIIVHALTPHSSSKAATSSPSLNSLAHRSAVETGFVEIRQCSDKAKGLGAFSTRHICEGDYIGEYYGEVLSKSQVRSRYYGKASKTADDQRWALDRSSRQQGTTGMYVFELKGANLFIDGEDAEKSGWCRFMNHASDKTANVKAFDKLHADSDLLVYPQFYAIRDIAKGEELCFFYGNYGHLLWEDGNNHKQNFQE